MLLFPPVSIPPLIDTEDAYFDLNAFRPIAKGDLKWRDALLVSHRVNSNKKLTLSHNLQTIFIFWFVIGLSARKSELIE